jgi:hypothetical protein
MKQFNLKSELSDYVIRIAAVRNFVFASLRLCYVNYLICIIVEDFVVKIFVF